MQKIENEIWLQIEGWEGMYEVSNLGRIKSMERWVGAKNGNRKLLKERILIQIKDRLGYFRVGLHRKNKTTMYLVHRLIALSFIYNNENKPQINHINGNPSDNRVDNLEWNTSKENIRHSFDILKRKPNIMSGEKCWLFGKKGKDHPSYGNKNNLGKSGSLHPQSKKVICSTFNIEFDSLCLAAKALDVWQANITSICKGRMVHTKGLTFRYI